MVTNFISITLENWDSPTNSHRKPECLKDWDWLYKFHENSNPEYNNESMLNCIRCTYCFLRFTLIHAYTEFFCAGIE